MSGPQPDGKMPTPTPTRTEAVNGFVKLSLAVWLRPPSPSPSSQDFKPSHPASLVVLCGWLGASIRHLTKYADGYSRILPGATILIIQCSIFDAIFPWGSVWHQYRLRPAIETIEKGFAIDAAGSQGSQQQHVRSRVLLHAFSNGGALTSSLLLAYFAKTKLQECDGLILDSCPGQGTYLRTVNGFIIGAGADKMPAILRLPLSAVAYVGVLFGLVILPRVVGQDNTIILAARALNDISLLDPDVPRLYMYSKSDRLVPWQDVVIHAEDARKKGFLDVDEAVFRLSGHCGHVLEDSETYWSSVAELVKRASVAGSSPTSKL